ncbi:PRC-barrel domain-containing protein [Bradyrhizobium icense]|uniref:PRC-barrel domain-containing protein n=1 Tax=Bradyrhizobium icense TaxID=1274631 RepID=A0A1B1UDP6_9BRAD|nr:PRC-barrel domain-containing protein [Bradyrhizobium icense]ANW00884.1 hypothetical protein LMTR13_12565 [Bradyrhizobium icense]
MLIHRFARTVTGFAATLVLLGAAALDPAVAQDKDAISSASNPEQRQRLQIVPLSAEELYRGWRASKVLGKQVNSVAGASLGTTRNLIVGPDGQIRAVVVEGNKRGQSREFMFRVPWLRLELSRLPGRVTADIDADHDPVYGIFRNDDQHVLGEFAVTEIIGDYARLQAGQGYGYVSDAVFTRAGNLIAVLITRDSRSGGGTYAFGFPERPVERWNAGASYFGLPYATAEHADAAAIPVDLTRFRDGNAGAE